MRLMQVDNGVANEAKVGDIVELRLMSNVARKHNLQIGDRFEIKTININYCTMKVNKVDATFNMFSFALVNLFQKE